MRARRPDRSNRRPAPNVAASTRLRTAAARDRPKRTVLDESPWDEVLVWVWVLASAGVLAAGVPLLSASCVPALPAAQWWDFPDASLVVVSSMLGGEWAAGAFWPQAPLSTRAYSVSALQARPLSVASVDSAPAVGAVAASMEAPAGWACAVSVGPVEVAAAVETVAQVAASVVAVEEAVAEPVALEVGPVATEPAVPEGSAVVVVRRAVAAAAAVPGRREACPVAMAWSRIATVGHRAPSASVGIVPAPCRVESGAHLAVRAACLVVRASGRTEPAAAVAAATRAGAVTRRDAKRESPVAAGNRRRLASDRMQAAYPVPRALPRAASARSPVAAAERPAHRARERS